MNALRLQATESTGDVVFAPFPVDKIASHLIEDDEDGEFHFWRADRRRNIPAERGGNRRRIAFHDGNRLRLSNENEHRSQHNEADERSEDQTA